MASVANLGWEVERFRSRMLPVVTVALALALLTASTNGAASLDRSSLRSASSRAVVSGVLTPIPVCKAAWLDGGVLENSSGGAGSIDAEIALHDVSNPYPCYVDGFPTVKLFNANRQPIPTRESRLAPGNVDSRATRVVLQPGWEIDLEQNTWASFDLDYRSPIEANVFSCGTSSTLAVLPPGDVQRVVVPAVITAASRPCGKVVVGALYAGGRTRTGTTQH